MGNVAQQAGFFPEDSRIIAQTARGSIVYYPEVFGAAESAALFEELLAVVPWSNETMKMYDKMVDVPRLVAWYRDPDVLPQALELIRKRVSGRLGVTFNAVSLNYYRDGTDSVAWHSDHDEDLTAHPTVALASFGATRQMQMRTKQVPRTQRRCDLEPGSVLSMDGDVQAHWEHHIPKVHRATDPRISVALRTKRDTARTAAPSAAPRARPA